MRRKIKVVLIFFLGLITPIIVIIFLCGLLYVNSVDRLNSVDFVLYREINAFVNVDRITLVDLYRASTFSERQLFSNVSTSISDFTSTFEDRAKRLVVFRADRVRSKANFVRSLAPYVQRLVQFEVDWQRPDITDGERLAALEDQIQNISELIDKLHNSDINFTDEIARLEEIKGNLVALKGSLTLTPEEKETLKTEIILIIDENLFVLPPASENIAGGVYQGDIETLSPAQKVEILKLYNTELINNISFLETELQTAKDEITRLNTELEKSKTIITNLTKDVKALELKLKASDGKNEVLSGQLKNAIVEIKKLNAKITAQEAVIKRLSNTNQINSGELDNLGQGNKALQDEIIALNKEITSLENQLTEVVYASFEEYVYADITAPIVSDFNKQFAEKKITNIEITTVDNLYQTITFKSDIAFTNEEMNYLSSLVTKQLALTSYNANIELIYMPNNTSINVAINQSLVPILH